ncbi:unnamed protein product [Symbiodinium natans]|uniref:HEAT repeat domain-containing protein n=1 Tax=Symbiodinium natans TaxID=878477 RepID=A0A812P6K4_9DINO|nr:unnamed protein product [Symbiodinium natans]
MGCATSATITEDNVEDLRTRIRKLKDPQLDDAAKARELRLLGKWPGMGPHIAAEGGVSAILELLEGGSDWLKKEAAEALFCRAQGDDDFARAIVACGGRAQLEAVANDGRPDPDSTVVGGRNVARAVLNICQKVPETAEAAA